MPSEKYQHGALLVSTSIRNAAGQEGKRRSFFGEGPSPNWPRMQTPCLLQLAMCEGTALTGRGRATTLRLKPSQLVFSLALAIYKLVKPVGGYLIHSILAIEYRPNDEVIVVPNDRRLDLIRVK